MGKNEITIDDLFTKNEIKILHEFKISFDALLSHLSIMAAVSERYPTSFTINGTQYNFFYGKQLEENIARLRSGFNRHLEPQFHY